MPRTKLDAQDKDDIYDRFIFDLDTQADLAEEYKVTLRYIKMIIQEQNEAVAERAKDREKSCGITWDSNKPNLPMVKQWIRLVYANAASDDKGNGFSPAYAKERLAYFENLDSVDILESWKMAMLDGLWAFTLGTKRDPVAK